VVAGAVDDWYREKHRGGVGFDPSYEELLAGEDCCSKTSISFHYVEHMEAKALFAIRQSLLSHPKMSDHDLKSMINNEWPKEFKDLGGYSRGLPKDDDVEGWRSLLAVIRKISTRETQHDC
jgi:hypothetical protein